MQERQTKQKSIIYDALTTLDHPTATEVYAFVHEQYPSVSRATVFRVLGGFVSGGKAQELRVAGNDVRYDYNVKPHYHVHCRYCGRVGDVKMEKDVEVFRIADACGFKVDGYSISFFGECDDCRRRVET